MRSIKVAISAPLALPPLPLQIVDLGERGALSRAHPPFFFSFLCTPVIGEEAPCFFSLVHRESVDEVTALFSFSFFLRPPRHRARETRFRSLPPPQRKREETARSSSSYRPEEDNKRPLFFFFRDSKREDIRASLFPFLV